MSNEVSQVDELVVFPYLADVAAYFPCQFEFVEYAHRRPYWVQLFREHYSSMMRHALEVELAQGRNELEAKERLAASETEFNSWLDIVDADPAKLERFDTIALCRRREWTLRKYGIADPYQLAKTRETEAALQLAEKVFADHDKLDGHERLIEVAKGVFAGNIFDLGAKKTIEIIDGNGGGNGESKKGKDPTSSVDFHGTLDKLKPRPWLYDDLDLWAEKLENGRGYKAAVLFVDNAGCDVVLGMMGLTRELLRRGIEVIVTANSEPALNDVLYSELVEIVERISGFDEIINAALRERKLELVASGNDVPLIDLTQVSRDLVEAAERRGVDLVVLEGMGRGVESNFHAPFTCDVVKVAMLKDIYVAKSVGGEVFDLVFKYEKAGD